MEAQTSLAKMMKERDLIVPPRVLVSAGFPKYGHPKAIGQCWAPENTPDGTTHIFISPALNNPVDILATHLHELVHAAVGCECGHKGEFVKGVRSLGLAGKPTATYAEPGSALHDRLQFLCEELGPYPHSPLVLQTKKRPPGGGWIKLVSPENEDYILRISPKAIENGMPSDPWGNPMIREDGDND